MAFTFTCPYCFKKTLVDESIAGQSGPCVACGKEVHIPAHAGQHVTSGAVQVPSRGRFSAVRASGNLQRVILAGGVAAILISVLAATLYLFWPTIEGLKARRDKAACMNNLRQIALALNAYAARHGSYPPPIVYDDKGKPMHSWRVLILPELGEEALYARYNFKLPWDSPDNIRLLGVRCPRVFISPAISNSRSMAETNYFLITGKGTLFPPSGSLGPQDIADGPGNTLLVVESQNTMIEWTKPSDIDFGKLNTRIGAGGQNKIGGNHQGGATAVFADARPAWLPDDLAPEKLNALISPAGGEPVDPTEYELR